jgi:putative inorganic carbon (HCO3(-)) transporter
LLEQDRAALWSPSDDTAWKTNTIRRGRIPDRVSRFDAGVAVISQPGLEPRAGRSSGFRGAASLSPVGALGAVVGYAIFHKGGTSFVSWNACLSALGVLTLAYWLRVKRTELAPSPNRWLAWGIVLGPVYVAFQLLPLPVFLLQLLSPNRAGLVTSLGTIMQPPVVAALSISPAVTVPALLNIVGCALTFLLVRELGWRSRQRLPWVPAIPLIGVAAVEAGLALVQAAGGAEVAGTYWNKNHLAGLLGMVLPMAAVFAITFAGGDQFSHGRGGLRAAGACLAFAIAGVILLGLVSTQSKMGFIAGLCGLLVMGVSALITTSQRTRRWVGVGGLVAACFVAFLLLPTDHFVSNFGVLSSEDWSEGRWTVWRDSLNLLSAYPVFGSGLGSFGVAFLKYQTTGVDRAFTFAHNDYLQFLVELGAVGFSVFFGLMLMVVAQTIHALKTGHEWQTRLLASGCTGAFAAIAVHSVADFNLYIPANALLLAWISGIAASLPFRSVRDQERPRRAFCRRLAVVLACVLVVYAPAGVVAETVFRGHLEAERRFCRFGICDTDAVVEAQTREHGGIAAAVPIAVLLEAVRRDPADPHRWFNVGHALARSGRIEQARSCFATAVALGPDIPPVLLSAADFYYEVGEHKRALAQTSRVLERTDSYDNIIFEQYGREHVPVAEVLANGLPNAPRASQQYLRYLIRTGNFAETAVAWNWVLSHRYADDRLANEYVDFLYLDQRYERAAQSWALYVGDRGDGYSQSNWVFNAGFESMPAGGRFDWTMDNLADDVVVELDSTVARTGTRSLRVRFAGKENVSYSHVFQTMFVRPGSYRFQAFVRAQDITTDQGLGFQLFDAEDSRRLDVRTEQTAGSTDWKMIEQIIRVPPETRLLMLRVVRPPSLKFDSHIAGTAWIDDVSLSGEAAPQTAERSAAASGRNLKIASSGQ